jgi:TonB-linked SusC/RagA family outer membrane protein
MSLAIAQNKQVSGTVTDETGEPVIGASVVVKGNASVGTVTNLDGQFILAVPSSAQTLLVRYLGKQDTEVAVAPNVSVTLQPADTSLDEVLVVAYGTSTRGTFTGSAGIVKGEDLSKRQVSNVSQALSGAVAGVQTLSSNGQPGVSATVRIRGVGSINAGSAPLYVVDGIPFDGDLASINPNDIETMTVLKDAASTTLYGARGANGIIMITTKKGTSGKATINFEARYGVNSRGVKNYDVFTNPQSYIETQYKAIYNAGIYNLGYNPVQASAYANNKLSADSEGGSGYKVYTVPDGELLVGINGKLNPNATLGYSDADYYYTPDNWANEMFHNNPRQEYNLTFSGAQNDFNYYASFGYLNDEGVIDNSGYSRLSGRLKADYQIKKWLKVGANVNYNYAASKYPDEQINSTSSGNAFFIANNIAPIYPLYVRDAATKSIMTNGNRKVYDYGEGISTHFLRGFMQIANPVGDLIYNKRDFLMDIVNTNWFAEIKPVKGLTLTAKYGLHLDNTQHHDMGNAYMGQSAQYGGTVYQEGNRTFGFDQQYLADYRFNLSGLHSLDLMAGYDGYSYSYEELSAYGINMYNPENYYAGNVIDKFTIGGYKDTYATEGYFVRVNYSYDEKYFANAAFRRDASSRFHPDNRWGNFWSASAAWALNRESFLQDLDWVNLLKLKASYGQQGNDALGIRTAYYAYLDQYSVTGSDGVFSDGVLEYKGNPDLTWETSNSYNVGVDFSLFSDKLAGTIEYFGRTSSDMLYNKPVAGSVGYSKIPMNIGSMTNSGLEIDLAYDLIKTNNLKWTVNANATLIKNIINELHPDLNGRLEDGTRLYEEGYSMYRMYLPDYAGVDPENGMALYWAEDEDGNRETTNDYTIAQQYKVASDDLLADVYGGFGTSINAFGFDASVQFSYQLGGQIYDNGYARLMHGGTSSYAGTNWHKDILNAWSPDNTNTDVPRLNANDRYANNASTRFLTSSDYLSLNNVTIGYTLPSKLLKKWDISKLRVYLVADNIYLLSARNGLDPRQSYTAATTSIYTAIRTISGGISLTF